MTSAAPTAPAASTAPGKEFSNVEDGWAKRGSKVMVCEES